MTTLREAAEKVQSLIAAARLCEVNSMSSRQEMLRLMIEATDTLRAALAEPTRSQRLQDAGFQRRDNTLRCDECSKKFTRQMLPIHKCDAMAEPGPSGWQPIETAPKDGSRVDLWIETPHRSWREPDAYWHKDRWWIDNHGPWGEGEGPIDETVWRITRWIARNAPAGRSKT